MVLLSMTKVVAAAVEIYLESGQQDEQPEEPALVEPAPGKPISHSQLVDVSRFLKAHPEKVAAKTEGDQHVPVHLSELLRGCSIYQPPPPPKPEPSSEYKALMARLRAEEEARQYERMIHPPVSETFRQRFPMASDPISSHSNDEDDEITYADINRQLTMIINVLVSVVACAVALWMVARYWSTPRRLALSFSGSIVVVIAEVTIYAGYLQRLTEAKVTEKKKSEVKEIAESWIIEPRKGVRKLDLPVEKWHTNEITEGLRQRSLRND
ncbi:hypothetical protein EJ06DRAFT_473906 [Trichodelitschia bisporula]|uniref:Endoplasmic reticulum-based factor for assembly of V-ATPase n=1 Tax=Trichodelitschia bisporula TaxID=703511 RepID=A0A6G1I379_9PEZI|nr:hypothetical protein EJ06DRAFT_473906 [Trichodelitschia bisporula]